MCDPGLLPGLFYARRQEECTEDTEKWSVTADYADCADFGFTTKIRRAAKDHETTGHISLNPVNPVSKAFQTPPFLAQNRNFLRNLHFFRKKLKKAINILPHSIAIK